jgi:hypothetical protein
LFEPHVTIFIAPENSLAPLDVLREVGPVDIEWRFIAFDSVNNLRRRSYVQFERNSALQQLGDAIWRAEVRGTVT